MSTDDFVRTSIRKIQSKKRSLNHQHLPVSVEPELK